MILKGQSETVKWMTDNAMAKRKRTKGSKDRQYNGQKETDKRIEGQTIQWPKENGQKDRRTDNTMAKRKWTKRSKDRQYNGQKIKGQMDKWTNNDLQNITQKKLQIEQHAGPS